MVWKPVTAVNRRKCLVEAVKRHFGFLVDVQTSNLPGRGNKQSGNFLLLQRCCGTMWHHMAPCNLCTWKSLTL